MAESRYGRADIEAKEREIETTASERTLKLAPGSGDTPLLKVAARNGSNQLQAIAFLIERGANLKATNSDGDTVIHRAAFTGSPDVLSYFIKRYGEAMHHKNKDGGTPLMLAAHR